MANETADGRSRPTFNGEPFPDPYVTDLHSCARCGGNHEGVEFRTLTRPNDEWVAWAPCPENGEPIMLAVVEAP